LITVTKLDVGRDILLVPVVDPFADATVSPEQTSAVSRGLTHVCTNVELDTVGAGLPDAGTAYVMFNDLPRIGDAWRSGIWSGASPEPE
jgi:hypothetical protein